MAGGSCTCGGACHHAQVPQDTAGIQAYLRDILKDDRISVVAEGTDGIWLYVPRGAEA